MAKVHLKRRIIDGLLSGLVATVPMTAVMTVLYRRLPRHEQYPLPPRLITESLTRRTRPGRRASLETMSVATWISHFGYGALNGALYSGLTRHPDHATTLKGAAYGLAVWAGNYLGFLPQAGILPSATRRPIRRNLLTVAAHLVWGIVLGWTLRGLSWKDDEHEEEHRD